VVRPASLARYDQLEETPDETEPTDDN
jgi:hypothetical protein